MQVRDKEGIIKEQMGKEELRLVGLDRDIRVVTWNYTLRDLLRTGSR
jgi:hypothetical protein